MNRQTLKLQIKELSKPHGSESLSERIQRESMLIMRKKMLREMSKDDGMDQIVHTLVFRWGFINEKDKSKVLDKLYDMCEDDKKALYEMFKTGENDEEVQTRIANILMQYFL